MAPISRLYFSIFAPSSSVNLINSVNPPTIACSILGHLTLLPQGGVSVNGLSVQVPLGTFVGLGFGLGVKGTGGGSLWWNGTYNNIQGIWTLDLVHAVPRETVTIQRILLFLPPLPPPSPFQQLEPPMPHPPSKASRRPTYRHHYDTPHPTYRNSLLLLDDETLQEISVLPLNISPRVPPKPEKFHSTPLPPSPPKTPNKGAELAAQVDDIVDKIFPGSNLGTGTRVDYLTRAKQEEDSSEQMAQSGGIAGVFSVTSIIEEGEGGGGRRQSQIEHGFALLDAALDSDDVPARLPSSSHANESAPFLERTTEDDDVRRRSRLEQGFAILDSAMGSLDPPFSNPAPKISFQELPLLPSRPESVSSFATTGTDRFVTASESGDTTYLSSFESRELDARSSIASFASDWTALGREFSRSYRAPSSTSTDEGTFETDEVSNDNAGEEEISIKNPDQESDDGERTSGSRTPQQATTPPPRSVKEVSTATDNGVLLRYLTGEGASQVSDHGALLKFLTGEGGSRLSVVATPVTQEEIARDGLVPVADAEGGGEWLESWFGIGIGTLVKSLGSWFSLSSWTGGSSASGSDTTATLSATQSQPAPTNPTSYPSNSSLFFPSYTASSLAGTPRPIRRRANGEGTSRLSVVYFDDEGYGRKAYIDGAGGGFGGVGGILGRY